MTKISVSEIRVSEIRVREIRISSNHRELHGAIFLLPILVLIVVQRKFGCGWWAISTRVLGPGEDSCLLAAASATATCFDFETRYILH